uniref:Uncharacterized protein n=1 Tax=Candidatus Kentrum sp. LPFa TaxID=2126335 RepID=A0A450VXQ7_9GAMM|nr:MAG: hypothetical protein BECKLPF1236B_GA0070989_101020 [Candidatus Kentron sp. LPFa]
MNHNLNSTKPEPKIFVHYSPVIPLISGNPVTNISLIFLDRFVEDFLGNGLNLMTQGWLVQSSRINTNRNIPYCW